MTKSVRFFFLFFLVVIFEPLANAHDLGIFGQTYPISEVSIKNVIQEQAKAIDWNKIGLKLKAQALNYGGTLKTLKLPTAQKTKTTYVDPSVALNRDVVINGYSLYQKGTWINPLRTVRPLKDMLFFNADSEEQTKFVLQALKAHPYNLMLVVTKGDPIKFSKQINRQVYFAFPSIIKRFHIQEVPSLLGVGEQKHEYELAITTFAEPYKLDLVDKCWHGCESIGEASS